MSKADFEQNQTRLPLRADPASGAIVGTFLLAACLAGPIGIGLAVIAWVLIDSFRRRARRARPVSKVQATTDEYAARFEELENDILGDR